MSVAPPEISIVLQESSPAPSPRLTSFNNRPLPSQDTSTVSNKGATTVSSNASPSNNMSWGAQGMQQAGWGSHFWVTLVDPQTQVSFFACPATGQVSWDAPVGNFVLPPSEQGEWWELVDDSRGIPYYYHTKTGDTVWERPAGFVIPLGVLQNTTLGRRLSTTFRTPQSPDNLNGNKQATPKTQKPSDLNRRSRSYTNERDSASHPAIQLHSRPSTRSIPGKTLNGVNGSGQYPHPRKQVIRRSFSSDQYHALHNGFDPRLSPIPASPFSTEVSLVPSRKSTSSNRTTGGKAEGSQQQQAKINGNGTVNGATAADSASGSRRSKSSLQHVPRRPALPQNLDAAVELITHSACPSPIDSHQAHPDLRLMRPATITNDGRMPRTSLSKGKTGRTPPSPKRPAPAVPSEPAVVYGREIGSPVLNIEATINMSPVKHRANGRPILVEPRVKRRPGDASTVSLGTYPILPVDLASDIQQFIESDFARQYFSTHRTGFIFKRKVPVMQMMTWQKAPLTSPLLILNHSLHKDAVKVFKVIQRIMGDRERDRPYGLKAQAEVSSTVASINGAQSAAPPVNHSYLLEEERWLLSEGLLHGELRDEIYCQVMKQLNGNSNPESVFKGWQLLCVLLITFPPSKNFEMYLHSFMHQRTTQPEGRVDVMAKYCIRRLAYISKKGPRGKAPTLAEVEVASDAAFNPSIFGESLDIIFRLQERNYPHSRVPIILPFLADGILALGGTKSEGIFRVPGDGDSVSELKLRIDRGYYNLDGVDDAHVPASLLKLWLRELLDPLVPDEMYNECITQSQDPVACVNIVQRLPTANRRVVLFVVSFLQLFLEERVEGVTKMTSPNLALVMAPNLLRCDSESMSVVFTNAKYEQQFVHNLLLHLKCDAVDPDYVPQHGLGAIISQSAQQPRMSKSRSRRS